MKVSIAGMCAVGTEIFGQLVSMAEIVAFGRSRELVAGEMPKTRAWYADATNRDIVDAF